MGAVDKQSLLLSYVASGAGSLGQKSGTKNLLYVLKVLNNSC